VCALATFSCLGDLLHGGVNSDKLRRTEHAVEAYRAQIDTHKAEKYGFASMAAVPYAHIVAQLLGKKRPKGTEISLAPNPKDIVSNFILALVCYTHFGLHRSGKT
jgi:calcium permeable stress-gated cation channel